ncbi:hypothetical protein LAZ67_14002216 [Cordylochernes scorpioides]|uniref:Reverse transcriptase zinc-binding domain-containing protein n=1 Tax=Cordylochernes scorpioides TaxID=51811 RepID=A0ABY6L6U1_9ARAC|nr:hypothetical protein LAZ67_14002216 [Cordylochernes scorpioides]
MLVVFFDYQGPIYYEFIKEGITFNKQACNEILVRLLDAIRRKRNQLFKSKQWKLLYMIMPLFIVQDYLATTLNICLAPPPYSLDIAPCDFFFFPKLKTLKGRRLSSSSELIENATVELNKLRKIAFELAFKQLFFTLKKKIKAVEDSSCFCGMEEQTSRHLLINCPAFQDYRMKNELVVCELNDLISNKKSYI